MAVATMRVPTVFTAIDRFSDVVSKMGAGVNRFGKHTTSALSRVDHKLNNVFNSMNSLSQLAIGGGVGGLFYYAGKDILEYEKAQASLAAVTGTAMGSMKKDIESLGNETKRSVIDISKSFENIGSKMSEYLKNPTALREIAKQSILMSNASRMTIEDSTDNLTSILNQFKLNYKDAARVVNKLSSGEDIGASTISESADVVRQFAASARMAGASLEETIALVQTTTKTLGKDGVGRSFRNIMVDLNTGKGMDKNKLKALSMVKADINKIINPATKFIDKLQEIKKLLSNKQAMGMFFKKTGFEVGATFLNSFKMFEDYLSFIQNNNTAIVKAQKNTSTLSYAIDALKASFTNFIVTNNSSNFALGVTKSLMRWLSDRIGSLMSILAGVILAFVGWKTVVLLANGALLLFNISLGVAATSGFILKSELLGNVAALRAFRIASVLASSSLWLWLAPLLLIIGTLTALGWLFYKSQETTKKFADNNRTHLRVVAGEYESMEDRINRSNARMIASMKKFRLDQLSVKNTGMTVSEATDARRKKLAKVSDKIKLQADLSKTRDAFTKPKDFVLPKQNDIISTMYDNKGNEIKKENLAGKNNPFDSKAFMESLRKGGTLEINLNDPSNVIKDVDKSKMGGIPAVVTSTKNPKKG